MSIKLADHYTGAEINAALERGAGFAGAFPGETADDDLAALRELFTRKALIARQAAVCEALLAAGASAEEVTAMRVAELPERPEARRCLELRRQLKIDCDPAAPAFVLPGGEPLASAQLERWLRAARLVRTSLEVNGGLCRSLLSVRHQLAADPEEVPR